MGRRKNTKYLSIAKLIYKNDKRPSEWAVVRRDKGSIMRSVLKCLCTVSDYRLYARCACVKLRLYAAIFALCTSDIAALPQLRKIRLRIL